MTEKTDIRKTKNRPWDAERVRKSTATQKTKTALMDEQAERILTRQGKKLKYDSSKLFAYKIADYFNKCDNTIVDTEKNKTEPYTLTGIQKAIGLYGGAWQKYVHGEHDKSVAEHIKETTDGIYIECNLQDTTKSRLYDYETRADLTPYMQYLYDNTDINAILYSSIYQKARLMVQEQAEKRLYIRGSVADIFTLKSKYGWQEQNTTVHRLEIATPEQAKRALQELDLLSE